MNIADLKDASCVIGLSYFDEMGQLLKRSQLCGWVASANVENGISVKLNPVKSAIETSATTKPAMFTLPPNLGAWFTAPKGHYRDADSGAELSDPDYLVTWDVHRKKAAKEEGEHQWWEWLPRTERPEVGSAESSSS